jgi:hypothetical protein
VIVDSNSIMTSIIMHGPSAVPDVACYPRPIMSWTEGVFGNYLKQYNKKFSLRENGKNDFLFSFCSSSSWDQFYTSRFYYLSNIYSNYYLILHLLCISL